MKGLILLATLVTAVLSDNSFSDPSVTADVCHYAPEDIEYLFYNLRNPTKPIIVPSNNFTAVKNTHFNKNKSTLLLIHGSGGNSSGPLVQTVRATIVKANLDVNIIGVEWQRFQLNNHVKSIYDCAPLFGVVVGNFLKAMVKDYGLNLDNTVMVGHSIAGSFCNEVGAAVNGQMKAIIGLESCSYKNRAKYIQCIHTGNANYSAMAHGNYYPNGGGHQPNCPTPDTSWCSHWRVIDLYAESLTTNKFIGRQCETYKDFKAGKCNKNPTGVMGGVIPSTTKGKFYLDTNAVPPYAKG